ncbi:class I SAM-dependent methyltransferase [Hyphomonas sp.]|uniref:SAM-dependent methyltransferase n=1 Tax=Hyphomonas sp. TaxID=87 RepID=UPI0030F97920
MSIDQEVAHQYRHGSLLGAIEAGLAHQGKSPADVTIEDLAPVDEFHVGGRLASTHFLQQLDIAPDAHLLDIGCGLGGAARFTADQYGARVTGIDLTAE